MSKQSGHSLVEFTLVFPFVVMLCVMAFQIALVSVQQWGWQRLCARTARSLAGTSLLTQPQLLAQARQLLVQYEPLNIRVDVQSVPTRLPRRPYRPAKHVEFIDLTLEKEKRPFRFRSFVREVRVR